MGKIPLLGEGGNNKEEENLVSLLKSKPRVSGPIVRARGAAAASREQRGADAKRLAPVPDLIASLPPALLPLLIIFVYLMII